MINYINPYQLIINNYNMNVIHVPWEGGVYGRKGDSAED